VWPLELPRGLARLAAALAAARIVFADPPYGGGPARDTLAALAGEGVLGPGVLVVIEHHHRDDLPEQVGTLRRTRERRHGETVVSTYRAATAAPREE
jgi:16S rRNA (guanine966-N2)-methyltransferase